VCHIHAREVVTVHHSLELVEGGVDEECRMGATAATPDNFGWGTIPGDRLSDYASAFRRCCHISTDVMESLSVGRASICLRDISASHYFFKRACWWKVRK